MSDLAGTDNNGMHRRRASDGWTVDTLLIHLDARLNEAARAGKESVNLYQRLLEDVDKSSRNQLIGLREAIEAKFAGMDKATLLLSETVNRVPTLLDRETQRLAELFDEKFGSVQRQFLERDVRSTAAEVAAQTAVNAALQAQKEAAASQNEANAAAVAKSEGATVKQIDSILALLASNTRAIDEKIASISSRLDRGDGGTQKQTTNQATMIAVAAVVVSILVGGVSLFAVLDKPAIAVPSLVVPAQTHG